MQLTPLQIYKAPVSNPNQSAAKPQQRKADVGFAGGFASSVHRLNRFRFLPEGTLTLRKNLEYVLKGGVDECDIFDDIKLVKGTDDSNKVKLIKNNKEEYNLNCSYDKHNDGVGFELNNKDLNDLGKQAKFYTLLNEIGQRSSIETSFKTFNA